MALADLNIVPATSATSLKYKHNYIKFRETNMHCFFYFFAVTKPQKLERKSLSKQWAAHCWPILQDTVLQKSDKRHLPGAFI